MFLHTYCDDLFTDLTVTVVLKERRNSISW